MLYNLQRFDFVRYFQDEISGFIDTYKLLKKVFDKETVSNYKQETLVKAVLGLEYDAHSVMSDVTSLKALYERKLAAECDASDVFNFAYYSVKTSFVPLGHQKVISTFIC